MASPLVMDIFFFSFYFATIYYLDLTHFILECSRLHDALYLYTHRLEVFNFGFSFHNLTFIVAKLTTSVP